MLFVTKITVKLFSKNYFVSFSFVSICKKPLEKRKIETDNITLRGLSLNYYFMILFLFDV